MTAPAGAEVGIYVDSVAPVAVGDVIETQTGRRYVVVARWVQERGMYFGRQHLRCVVLDPDASVGASTVHRIRWYARGRGRR